MQATKVRKKNFSSFTDAEAMKLIGIEETQDWNLPLKPFQISSFFQQRLARLDRFGISRSEGKKNY